MASKTYYRLLHTLYAKHWLITLCAQVTSAERALSAYTGTRERDACIFARRIQALCEKCINELNCGAELEFVYERIGAIDERGLCSLAEEWNYRMARPITGLGHRLLCASRSVVCFSDDDLFGRVLYMYGDLGNFSGYRTLKEATGK